MVDEQNEDLERLWTLLDRLAAIGRERRQRVEQPAARADEVASDG